MEQDQAYYAFAAGPQARLCPHGIAVNFPDREVACLDCEVAAAEEYLRYGIERSGGVVTPLLEIEVAFQCTSCGRTVFEGRPDHPCDATLES